MRHPSSVFRLSAASAVMLAIVGFAPVSQAIVCTNCATEFTQLANNLQLIDQLARQVELVRESIRQSENLVLNTTGLDSFSFGKTADDLRKVTSILGQAKSLSFTSASLDGQFAQKYKDYKTYAGQTLDTDVLAQQFQQWSEDTNSSVLSTLKAANLQNTQLEGDEETLLKQLEEMASTAEGRMQALQVANQISIAAARQTQKLRQLILVQLQLQANFIQAQTDRAARQDASFDKFLKTGRENVRTGDGKAF
jgi:P-type conjugative transfer protein TrbJ